MVVAAGSYSAGLLKNVGVRISVYPIKGVTITVNAEPWRDAPQCAVIDDGRLFGLVPIGNRLRASGSAEITGFDATPNLERCQAVVDNVISVFPSFAKCFDPATAFFWAGLRPVASSGVPYLGATAISQSLRQRGSRPLRLDDGMRFGTRGGEPRRGACAGHRRRRIQSDNALSKNPRRDGMARAKAFGDSKGLPISLALRAGDFIFTSAVGDHGIKVDKLKYNASGTVTDDGAGMPERDVETETRATIENLRGLLKDAGCTLQDIVDISIWFSDARDFKVVNRIYGEYLQQPAVSDPLRIPGRLHGCLSRRDEGDRLQAGQCGIGQTLGWREQVAKEVRLFHVDSFTSRALGGAAAPVIVLHEPLALDRALALAGEFNQSVLTTLGRKPPAAMCAI